MPILFPVWGEMDAGHSLRPNGSRGGIDTATLNVDAHWPVPPEKPESVPIILLNLPRPVKETGRSVMY
jgi:hypothetical protein